MFSKIIKFYIINITSINSDARDISIFVFCSKSSQSMIESIIQRGSCG